MSNLTLGSLFDGSGGFPLGGLLNEIIPIWASEIEPFPIITTMKRLPFIKHYGDICKMNGADIEPVDIITFGSPCTNMSVAGKREGLNGEQSVLFYEAIRIIKEMRAKTNDKYPRFIVWENVPGAFSSRKGEDFRSVLKEIIQIKDKTADVPMPKKSKWMSAGEIVGNGYSVAFRTIDAQFWGVAQRRRRIYLIADFASESAGKILFEFEGLSGYSPKGKIPWKGTTQDVTNCTGTPIGFEPGVISRLATGHCWFDFTCTLRAERLPIKVDLAQTLMATDYKGAQCVCAKEPKAYGICSYCSNSMLSNNPHSGIYEAETSRTLDKSGGNPSCNQGGMAVVSLQGSMIGRHDKNGPHGSGISEDISFTLNTVDRHSVVYTIDRETFNCGQNFARNLGISTDEVASTLNAQGPSAIAQAESDNLEYTVRRLTPAECALLQGFPFNWCEKLNTPEPTKKDIDLWADIFETHRKIIGKSRKPKTDVQIVKWLKNPHTDGAEYKMWGNGVALPCVCFVLAGIVWASENRK